ncbi:oxidoreductase [Sandaracinobacter sp. RS1-74]|uniref:oxidoreductase n=1 Tax=Sandaracinobacteroides sayramensis TaxID=2913411 RepID=UPI001EDB5CC1|nr:oxidoreductase [Sandaracinobacteroides sayramensis]
MTTSRTWLVTGASSGFGLALSRELLARGHRVAATARHPADIRRLAEIASEDRLLPLKMDITDNRQIESVVAGAVQRFGAIDVLVNNAGYGFLSTIEEAGDADVRRQFDTNVFGPAAMMRAVLPHMRAAGKGLVINFSSTAGTRGFAGSGYYSASKAALEALTEALAAEAGELGIRAMIVCPGPFRTDFFGRSMQLPATEIADYATTLAQRRSHVAASGTQGGDPVRAARIIVDTVEGGKLPMRLVLGGRALPTMRQALETKIADIEHSRQVAPLADFPEDA